MDERAFFDNLALQWDANEIKSTPDKINYILDFLDLRPGMRILDLGTGTGVLLPHLASRIGSEGSLTAVDYSEGMLSRAKEKFSGLSPRPLFLNMDFETETIEGEYDRIILYCVYPHLHTPVDTLKWLRSVNLKDNGIIVIAFPTGPDFINNIHRERHSDSDILPPAKDLATFLRDNGLKAEAVCSDPDSYLVIISR